MSTILKALQKVEENLRQQVPQSEVSDGVWGKPVEKPRRTGKWIWLVLLFLVCGVGVLGIWILSRPTMENRKIPGQAGSVPPVAPRPQEQTPVQPAPTPVAASVTADEPEILSGKKLPVAAGSGSGKRLSTRAKKHPPVPKAAAVPPRFVVTGIAYQQDRKVRFAIINDRAFGEGEVIQGAVVEEILEDRVRFATNGSTFEVALSKRPRR